MDEVGYDFVSARNISQQFRAEVERYINYLYTIETFDKEIVHGIVEGSVKLILREYEKDKNND